MGEALNPRNGTMYSGNILKMIIFDTIYSGTA